jgi:hypothetical protein
MSDELRIKNEKLRMKIHASNIMIKRMNDEPSTINIEP